MTEAIAYGDIRIERIIFNETTYNIRLLVGENKQKQKKYALSAFNTSNDKCQMYHLDEESVSRLRDCLNEELKEQVSKIISTDISSGVI